MGLVALLILVNSILAVPPCAKLIGLPFEPTYLFSSVIAESILLLALIYIASEGLMSESRARTAMEILPFIFVNL
jgi:hypothetical protein